MPAKYFKITRPQGSDRVFAFGFALRVGESLYVDHQGVATNFASVGWPAEELDKKPSGVEVHEALKTPSLIKLISTREMRAHTTPKGKWEVTAPPGWPRPFMLGFHVTGKDNDGVPIKSVVTDDYTKKEQFKDAGFTVTQLEGKSEKEAEAASNEKVEGDDAPKKGGMSTYTGRAGAR